MDAQSCVTDQLYGKISFTWVTSFYAGWTLSPREPETTRERECRCKHSLRMLSSSFGCLRLASFALTFLRVHDVQVKGSCVSPGCRLVSHSKIKYTLGHILVFIFYSFFNPIPGYFQEFGKRHPQTLIHSGRCAIFEKQKSKISITLYIGNWKFYNFPSRTVTCWQEWCNQKTPFSARFFYLLFFLVICL